MRKTFQIGDKYKPLMEYYSSCFDKEEFNIFITKLLIAYKKMKDKNIDLIILSDLIEPYKLDLIKLIKLIDNMDIPKSINLTNDLIIEEAAKKTITENAIEKNTIEIEKKDKKEKNFQNKIKDKENPILSLDIDLSN